MEIIFERITAMVTWEFIISAVIIAFIINVLSGIFLRKTIETPSVFKNKRLDQLKRQYKLLNILHSDPIRLICFSFRGIGMSIALFVLSFIIFRMPYTAIDNYYSIHFIKNQPPSSPFGAESWMYTTASMLSKDQKVKKQIFDEQLNTYNKQMADFNEKTRQARLNTLFWDNIFTLIGSIIAAASIVYAIKLYNTLNFVANFELMKNEAGSILSKDSDPEHLT